MTIVAPSELHGEALAQIADLDAVGVVSLKDADGTPLEASALAMMPDARSIVVVAAEIFDEVVDLLKSEGKMGEAAARDLYQPHLDFLNGRLNRAIYQLAKVYRHAGYRALPLPSQGTPNDPRFLRGILSFKHAAEYAGLGSIGRSSLLITPRFGPRVRLACLLTNAELPASRRSFDEPCSSCPGLCLEHCPAGALAAPLPGDVYAINKFACSSYRAASGGCGTCMAVCPMGR